MESLGNTNIIKSKEKRVIESSHTNNDTKVDEASVVYTLDGVTQNAIGPSSIFNLANCNIQNINETDFIKNIIHEK